jgi:hypothetical protein
MREEIEKNTDVIASGLAKEKLGSIERLDERIKARKAAREATRE